MAFVMLCLALIAGGAVRVGASSGQIRFFNKPMDVTEGNLIEIGNRSATWDYLGLMRDGGRDGTVNATLLTYASSTAVSGVDFDFLQTRVTWLDGDTDPKAIILIVYDNDIADGTRVLHLGLQADPPSANFGPFLEVRIHDNGDGGSMVFNQTEVYVDETFGAGECLLWAERTGGTSGIAELSLAVIECPKANEDSQARPYSDYLAVPSMLPLTWQDGESQQKCAVRSVSREAIINGGPRDWPEPLSVMEVLVAPDASQERDERFCLSASLSNISTAVLDLHTHHLVVVIKDKNQESSLSCSRGRECFLDVSETTFVADSNFCFLQDALEGESNCLPCGEVPNSSDVVPFVTMGDAGTVIINFSTSLLKEQPGRKWLCECAYGDWRGPSLLTASMQLHGPARTNTVTCAKSWPSCEITDLLGLGFQAGADHLRVLTSCTNPDPGRDGLIAGGHSVLDGDGKYQLMQLERLREAEAGMYALCWCRETQLENCEDIGDFAVDAGTFIFVGPNTQADVPPYALEYLIDLIIKEVYGVGLTKEDRAMLLPQCGEDDSSSSVEGSYNLTEHHFNFGRVGKGQGLLARTYKVCWCQPEPSLGIACSTPREFLAEIASIKVVCPLREVDLRRDGNCEPCAILFQTAGGPEGMQCVADTVRLVAALVWLLTATLLFLACISSFRPSRTFPFLQGVPRQIEDVSLESGSVIITVAGRHNLTVFSSIQSIPLTLTNTGHFLLDSTSSSKKDFRVRPCGRQSLQLLQADGKPLDSRVDSSMGFVRLSAGRTLLHSCIRGVPFPLLAQLVVLVVGWGVFCGFLEPNPWEVGFFIVVPLILAILIVVIWRFTLRPGTLLSNRLQQFSSVLLQRNPHPKACDKGPDRAIAVRDVLELFSRFGSFIRDRNMYYIDPNIIRPLTAQFKLSYAELVGPQRVQWFVSHWWGTEFQIYCEALQRHAKATCETGAWESTSYWICTLSNNQYQIKEELGSSHKESSFYLALHSGICRGTCMILDEHAMPLKRSWCLFELLQTIGLEKTQASFKGLLFCTANGVLNFGASTVEMAMTIGDRLSTMSLKDAEASTEQDKQMITELVLQEMESFEKIDYILREHVTDALSECQKRVDKDFKGLFRKLGTKELEDSVPLGSNFAKGDAKNVSCGVHL